MRLTSRSTAPGSICIGQSTSTRPASFNAHGHSGGTEVHLANVGVADLADLKVDDQQALEAAVEEQLVDVELAVVDAQPPQPAHESEVVAQFQ
jgi:hypothetical protein